MVRIIGATAIVEGLALVTADEAIHKKKPCKRLGEF